MADDKNSPTDGDNIKQKDNPPSNADKDPENWVSGDEAMTGAQKSYLTTLREEAGGDGNAEPPEGLTKAEASIEIDKLKAKLGK